MLARVFFYLPFKIVTPQQAVFTATSIREDDATVTIYPPQQFARMEGLYPKLALPPIPSAAVTFNNIPTVEMDVLVIEVRGEQLDRSPGTAEGMNPTLALAQKAANEFLARLRTVTQIPSIRQATGPSFIAFMNDEESQLESNPPNIRMASRVDRTLTTRNVVVDELAWDAAKSVTEGSFLHRDLLLDAFAIFPEATAITLAFTAVETVAKLVVRTLAKQIALASLGDWLGNRYKEPRIEHLIKGAIRGLSGVNLAEDSTFWIPFQRLVEVRNNLVHDGAASYRGQLFRQNDLHDLLLETSKLIDVLEKLASLPSPPTVRRTGSIEYSAVFSDWKAPVSIRLIQPSPENSLLSE